MNGLHISFVYSSNVEEIIVNRDKSIIRPILQGEDGKKYRLGELRKTAEFGGKGEGFGVRIEDQQINYLNIQIDHIKSEMKIPTIPVSISNTIYEISHVEKTFGTPKSDFELKGDDVWISHKDGKSPKDYQQWGGITEHINHPEVQSFITDIQYKYPEGMVPGLTIGRKINDPVLKHKSVYGIDYGSSYGINNVTYLVQGQIQLIKLDNCYTLTANKIHNNGDEMDGVYDPILFARYNTDRKQYVDNCRMMIVPFGSRNIKEII